MYPYVERFLHDQNRYLEKAYYLLASLFAYHPDAGGGGNIGHHFARTRDPNSDNIAIERRFTALLSAHSQDLHFYLRQAVSFLKSKEVPVNWPQLLADLRGWSHPDSYVQHAWARAFWGRPPTEGQPEPEPTSQQ